MLVAVNHILMKINDTLRERLHGGTLSYETAHKEIGLKKSAEKNEYQKQLFLLAFLKPTERLKNKAMHKFRDANVL